MLNKIRSAVQLLVIVALSFGGVAGIVHGYNKGVEEQPKLEAAVKNLDREWAAMVIANKVAKKPYQE
jgi:hydrogenase/urease accessory protein HupE